MGKNELNQWDDDEKTAKGIVIAGIVTGAVYLIKQLSKSQEQQEINIEIAECDATIQELDSKWFKSLEEKEILENAKLRKKQLLKQRKQ